MQTPASNPLPELDQMRAGVEYRFPVQLRGWRCSLRPITISEHMTVNQEVINELMGIPEAARNAINENYLLAKKILRIASKPGPDSKEEGPLQDYLLDRMTVEEVLYAYKQWRRGCEQCDPQLEQMTVDELTALVDKVKKNQIPLTDLSLWESVQIVKHFLARSD